jgi:type I restriction enzyme S subunit
VDPRFLVYSFQSLEASQYLTSRAESATRSHARVDPSDIIKFKIPRFAIEDQQRIADYLDRETAEIDALIAEKGRMLVLLEEKRAALVTRAVTRGLNPHAPLKPSGLEWLGDVPCAWTTHRFKNLFSIRDERSEDGKEELLTVSHISGVTPRSEKTVYMFKAEDMAGYKKCYPGDLITNTLWAFMGALGIARESGIVSPDYHVYEPNNQVDPEFLDLLVRSDVFKTEILRHSKGVWSSRLRLYPEEFFDIRFPLPPIDEQVRAVAEFQTVDKRDRQLTLEIDQSIQLLRERRSALITSAVTGQIPIEEMAG